MPTLPLPTRCLLSVSSHSDALVDSHSQRLCAQSFVSMSTRCPEPLACSPVPTFHGLTLLCPRPLEPLRHALTGEEAARVEQLTGALTFHLVGLHAVRVPGTGSWLILPQAPPTATRCAPGAAAGAAAGGRPAAAPEANLRDRQWRPQQALRGGGHRWQPLALRAVASPTSWTL